MFALLLSLTFSQVVYQDTEAFRQILAHHFAVAENGDAFFLNVQDRSVLQFDPSGKPIRVVSRKGDGPGECRMPIQIFLAQEKLYVVDSGFISVFHTQKGFLRRIRTPERFFFSHKFHSGWLSFRGFSPLEPDAPVLLVWHNDDFSEERVLYSWPPEIKTPRVLGIIDPLEDVFFTDASRDFKIAYARPSGSASILVIRNNRPDQVQQIQLSNPRVPISDEFKRKLLKIAVDETGIPEKTIRFSDFFPPVRHVAVTHDGKLLLTHWRNEVFHLGTIAANQPAGLVSAYTAQGTAIQPIGYDLYADRILTVRGDQVYFTYFDEEEEEYKIMRAPESDALNLVKSSNPHPVWEPL